MSLAPPPNATEILPGLEAAGDYDLILCDIWGVLHDGRRHFPAAADALTRFRARGGRVALITNAPRPHQPIRDQLDELGVPRSVFDAMATSGDVTVEMIAEKGAVPVWHIGPERDLALFDEVREITGAQPRLGALDSAEYVVCTGLFDDDVETPADYAAPLAQMRARDLPMICANPDIVVHRGSTLLYCAGALAQAYEAIGGTAAYAGKPHPPIYRRALRLAGAKPGDRVLAIGDAMATDMRGAAQAGVDGLFITHGIHRDALHPGGGRDLAQAHLETFLAGEGATPKWAMAQLRW